MRQRMTDKQSKRMEILSRLDELDRLQTETTDQNTKDLIDKRKAELRAKLETL